MLYDAIDFDLINDSDREMLTDNRMAIKNCTLTEATVNEYLGEEIKDYQKANLKPDQIYKVYRPLEEIQKVLGQYNGLDLIDDHHPMNGLKDNRKHAVGATGESAIIDGYKVKNTVFITDKNALRDIEMSTKSRGQFGKRCLSCSYDYTPVFEKGVFNKMPYDLKIKDLKLDHIALVEKGRVDSAKLSDSDKIFNKGNYMKELLKSTLRGIFGLETINDSQVEQVLLLNDGGGTSYSHKGTSHVGGLNPKGKYMKEVGHALQHRELVDEEMDKEEMEKMHKDKKYSRKRADDDEEYDEEDMDDKKSKKLKRADDKDSEKEDDKKSEDATSRVYHTNLNGSKKRSNDKSRKRADDEEEESKERRRADDEEEESKERKCVSDKKDKKTMKDAVNEELREIREVQQLCAKVIGGALSDSALNLEKEHLLNDTLSKLGYNVDYKSYNTQKIMIETLANARFKNNNQYYGGINDSRTDSNKFIYTVETVKKLGGN